MNEFLKLNWGITDLTQLEKQKDFIKEDVLVNSLVYKHLQSPINKNVKKEKKIFTKTDLYVPGIKFFTKKTVHLSSMNTWQHEQCLKAMDILHSGRELSNLKQSEALSLKVYKELQPKIILENQKYFEHAQKCWNIRKQNLANIKTEIYKYCKTKWDVQCDRFLTYSQYYKQIHLFNLKYDENENTSIEFNYIQNVLEVGELARFSQPSLKTICLLRALNLPEIEPVPTLNSKKSVSRDANIVKLLENHPVDVVTSSSALKRIADNADLKQNWIIPIIVKEIERKDEKGAISKRKVVFIDKPFPQTNPNKYYLAHSAFKNLLKTNFCQYEAFRFPATEPELNKEAEESAENPKEKRKNNKLYHNVNYRLWKITKSDDQNNLMKNKTKNVQINLLLRTKLAACENAGQVLTPIVIKPKLERQLSFGANIATQSELLREWTSLFFTPFSSLYRARIQSFTGEVIALERCSIQKVANEASMHYNCKPNLSLGVLERVFSELLTLEAGNYLLKHLGKDEAFVTVLKECQKGEKEAFDLFAEKEKCDINNCISYDWLPLDSNFVLPAFKHFNRVPCLFKPYEKKTKKTGKMNKKRNNV